MSNVNEKTAVSDSAAVYQQSSEQEDASLTEREPSSMEKFKEFMHRIWAYEIFSAFISLAAIGAMVGVLAYMNNLPLTSWTARISPNTVISILSTLCKATLMTVVAACIAQLRWIHYRAAPQKLGDLDTFAGAKGTMGSLKLAWGVSKKQTSGRVAAFGAIIIALTIAIDPFSQQVLKYSVEDDAVQGDQALMPAMTGVTDSNTILDDNSAWKGLYGGLLGYDYPMSFGCVSGNCTWPAFASLGVCATCESAPTLFGGNGTTVEATMGNLSMILKNGVPASGITNGSKVWTLVQSAVSDAFPLGLDNPTLFQVILAQLLVNVQSKPQNFTPAWNVTTCNIGWCGRVYQGVNVTKGVLNQPSPTIVDLQVNTTDPCYGGTTCQAFVAPNSVVNASYHIDIHSDSRNIRELLNFEGDVTALANNTWDVANALTVTASLFWNINATKSLTKACDTYTDFGRTLNAHYVTGTTLQTVTYIRVRWAWLALPAAVTLCSLLLLIMVIAVNRDTMLWKNSSLPLILHPTKHHGKEPELINPRPSAMSKQADGMQVKLMHGHDGVMSFALTDKDGILKKTRTGMSTQ